MKALKTILIVVAVIAVAVAGVSWYLVSNLDRMVQETVVKTGTKQLGTAVSLDSVSISIPQASARLGGLRVDNPEGYSDRPVLVLDGIEVDIDLGSLDDDVLVIEAITIDNPVVNFEMNRDGVSNLDVLQEKLGGHGGSSKQKDERRLVIDRLDVRGGTITASADIRPDDELVFDFPVVFMTDLGRPDGATPDEIGAEVSAVLLERSIAAAKRAGVERLVEVQKERLQEKAEEKLEEKLKDLLKRD
ncbi:MAG: hypothetical protein GWM87_13275 [Xanthomonadales bacterium]|nr:hypothetical protein [Xanthomonadales bacterium]NIX13792.1 hypothetical protein [Xanthomonadales bacterium]